MTTDARGERLAPVFYLPGAAPAPSVAAAPSTVTQDAADWTVPGLSRSAEVPGRLGDSDAPEHSDDSEAPGVARHVSITALARKGMSRREMERHLAGRGFEPDEVAAEVARLEASGYLDDVALAQTLVGTLQERKGLGRSAIAAELTRRLLTPAAIEYALELVDSADELARAREIASKRAAQLRGVDRDAAVRRLSAYLARRGYGGSTVRAAVDHALPRTASGVVFR